MSEAGQNLLREGDIIGDRYRVLAPLGMGGMGMVYRVEHTLMGKEMALKLLRPELSEMPHVVERFEREARSASKLDDPHIVRVTDFGRARDGSLFLVMELLEGQPLSARLQGSSALPVDIAIDVADQVLEALAHAHQNGVVHRDLKPDNIMLAEKEGHLLVKILDFGIAKMLSGPSAGGDERPLTQAGMVFGTPKYMSPEQAAGESVDPRSDLYAVGVLLYEMLSGQAPFDGESSVDILAKHLTLAPPPLEIDLGDARLENALESVVLQALSKRRQERFSDASSFRDALSDARNPPLSGPGSQAGSKSGSKARARTSSRTSSRGGSRLGAQTGQNAIVENFAEEQALLPRASSWMQGREGTWNRQIPVSLAGVAALLFAGLAIILFMWLGASEPQLSLEKGEEALKNGDLKLAHAIIELALAGSPNDARAHLLQGHLAMAEKEHAIAALAYGRAMEIDQAIAEDAKFQENARILVRKGGKSGEDIAGLLAERGSAAQIDLLVEIADTAAKPKMRRSAYEGLERLKATDRLESLAYLTRELKKNYGEGCKTRKWYVERMARSEDRSVLPMLKKELGKRGGIWNLESINACMEKDLKQYIHAHEEREKQTH